VGSDDQACALVRKSNSLILLHELSLDLEERVGRKLVMHGGFLDVDWVL